MNEIVKNFCEELDALCEGLWVMSETDAPIKPFEWKKVSVLDEVILKEKLKQSPDALLETQTLEDFFIQKITPQDWHGEEEKKSVLGFQNLFNAVKEKLTDAKVIKTIGAARREVLIVGKLESGHFAGLKTYTVET
jgi:Nuclease A inhibitor-like protein